MVIVIMNKILLYNYSLSVWFAGKKKKHLFNEATWFFFSSELFCITVSAVMFIISLIEFKISGLMLLLLFLLIWLITFYGIKGWVLEQLKIKKTEYNYKLVSKLWLYRVIGILLYFGSAYFFLLIGILTFQGYLNR